MGSWRNFRHTGLIAGMRNPAGFAKSAMELANCAVEMSWGLIAVFNHPAEKVGASNQ
jgi:hypothetical protein